VGYQLRRRESVSKGLKRVIRDELRSATEQLAGSSPSDDSIHEARKSINYHSTIWLNQQRHWT
jgi:hypothetical protein